MGKGTSVRKLVGNITGQDWAEAQAYQGQNKEQYRRRTGILTVNGKCV